MKLIRPEDGRKSRLPKRSEPKEAGWGTGRAASWRRDTGLSLGSGGVRAEPGSSTKKTNKQTNNQTNKPAGRQSRPARARPRSASSRASWAKGAGPSPDRLPPSRAGPQRRRPSRRPHPAGLAVAEPSPSLTAAQASQMSTPAGHHPNEVLIQAARVVLGYLKGCAAAKILHSVCDP